KSPRHRQLHLLRRVESALRRTPFFHDGDGFLAGETDCKGRGAFAPRLVGRQCVHESEHARVFQIRKFPPSKFPMAARARGHHLPTTTPRYFASGRNFILHLPFAFLHPRHLSRRFAADAIVARLHSRGFVFSTACCRSNRARGRFSSATGQAAATAHGSISLGI